MRLLHHITAALNIGHFRAAKECTNLNIHSDRWGLPPENFTRPDAVVIWHGLGDNYNSLGMQHIESILGQILPNAYIHSVYIDEDSATDERRSLFGDANVELDIACQQLSQIPELSNGFGAIGFSQGGLFMRALVERCPNVTVSKLITFGLPHMGVSELPLCENPRDWVCKRRNEFLKRNVWDKPVQQSVVPAQYFRDPFQYQKYIDRSNFLAVLNNERTTEDSDLHRERFSSLEKLVLVQFSQDTTLVPRESATFQEIDPRTGTVVPMDQTRLYREDLIGLRELHQGNRIDFYTVDEKHMQFSDPFFVDLVSRYFGTGL